MTIIDAILLGIVQGLTEFIPVSSSGHLVLAQEVLGVSEIGLSFDIALHLGTLLALLIFFYKDIWELVLGLLGKNDKKRLAWLLIVATIPAALAGFFIREAAETTLRAAWITATMLISVGLIILLAEYLAKKRSGGTNLDQISTRQAIGVGLAQVLALIPGTSRAGATITAGLLFGMDRIAATRFSFLLAIPIILGAILGSGLDGNTLELFDNKLVLLIGVLTSFASGLFAIRFLLRFLSRHTLNIFAYYRILLGILVLSGLIAF